MKKIIVILPLVAALSGCISAEARKAYESAKADLIALQSQFQAEKLATGKENQILISALKDAEAKVAAAKADMAASKIPETAQQASDWLGMLGPLVGIAFPPAMGILGGLQTVLAGFAASRRKVA